MSHLLSGGEAGYIFMVYQNLTTHPFHPVSPEIFSNLLPAPIDDAPDKTFIATNREREREREREQPLTHKPYHITIFYVRLTSIKVP